MLIKAKPWQLFCTIIILSTLLANSASTRAKGKDWSINQDLIPIIELTFRSVNHKYSTNSDLNLFYRNAPMQIQKNEFKDLENPEEVRPEDRNNIKLQSKNISKVNREILFHSKIDPCDLLIGPAE